ncbi:MAG TPA: hypothetical protein PLH14_04800 [Sphaerochaeta sp.]|nr:hypothetical protein [Sphaerochaeta sp.]HQB90343.1 hypothetical protein [Sphaerochaeta sp.]
MPDRHPYLQRETTLTKRGGEVLPKTVLHRRDRALGGIEGEDEELVASPPADDIRASKVVLEARCHHLQRSIPLLMTEGVVDLFEEVDVDGEQHHRITQTPAVAKLLLGHQAKAPAIVESGQVVGERQVEQLLLLGLVPREVAYQDDGMPIFITLDPGELHPTTLLPHPHLDISISRASVLQEPFHLGGEWRLYQREDRLPDEIALPRASHHPDEGTVRIDDTASCVGATKAVREAVYQIPTDGIR